MNSKYEKRLSLEELTKLNEQTPKEEVRMIQISEGEWVRLSNLLQRMEMLTEQKNTEERNLTETANTLKKLTEEQTKTVSNSIRKIRTICDEQVGKVSENVSRITSEMAQKEQRLWILRYVAFVGTIVFNMAVSIFFGWLQRG